MSTPKTPNDSINDEDMHALFQRGSVDVPTDLDNAVLAAAREAVNTDTHTETSPKSKSDSTTFKLSWAQGLATAAVVVLGIVLVPMMIPSQKPSLEMADAELGVSTKEFIPIAPTSSSITIESVELAPAPSDLRAVTSPLEREAVSEEKATSAGMSQTGSSADGQSTGRKKSSAAASSVIPEILEPSEDIPKKHRESPEAWVEEILRLHKDKDTKKSREEFTLFAARYPDHKLISEIPKEIREAVR